VAMCVGIFGDPSLDFTKGRYTFPLRILKRMARFTHIERLRRTATSIGIVGLNG
jgi:hypothetical protein